MKLHCSRRPHADFTFNQAQLDTQLLPRSLSFHQSLQVCPINCSCVDAWRCMYVSSILLLSSKTFDYCTCSAVTSQ